MLLETKTVRNNGYQKQQDTLIVWTGTDDTDVALNFEKADRCTAI
jgi:protein phosphatase-4 regulatory subunit 3